MFLDLLMLLLLIALYILCAALVRFAERVIAYPLAVTGLDRGCCHSKLTAASRRVWMA